jgi:hypothetical protein
LFEWLKGLFGRSSEEPPPEGPFDEDELPAGQLTGLTSPLYPGGGEPVHDDHP